MEQMMSFTRLDFSQMNSDWNIGDDYELDRKIGSGVFGDVFEAREKSTGRTFAIKRFKRVLQNEVDSRRMLREVQLFKKLDHPCVVGLHKVLAPLNEYGDLEYLYLVMELAEMDLRKLLKKSLFMTIDQVRLIIYNLLCGIRYLHSSKILHRDLKPANVLINEDCSVKICDFGLARSLDGLVTDQYNMAEYDNKAPDEDDCGENAEDTDELTGNSGKTTIDTNTHRGGEYDTHTTGDDYIIYVSSSGSKLKTSDNLETESNASEGTDDGKGEHLSNGMEEVEEQEEEDEPDVGDEKTDITPVNSPIRTKFNSASRKKSVKKLIKTSSTKNFISKDARILENQLLPPSAASEGYINTPKKCLLSSLSPQEKRALFKKNQSILKMVQRELTSHVVTRWYRAPELILLEKIYTSAVDIWSVGCIFAELLNTIKENAPTFFDRKPLFPGRSCFPLSPGAPECGSPTRDTNGDQLGVIFDVIGSPQTEEELGFITESSVLERLNKFPKKTKKDLKEAYPGVGEDVHDLLEKMLLFNPYQRITAAEALKHPFFDSITDRSNEIVGKTISIDIDKLEQSLTPEELKQLFLDEVNM